MGVPRAGAKQRRRSSSSGLKPPRLQGARAPAVGTPGPPSPGPSHHPVHSVPRETLLAWHPRPAAELSPGPPRGAHPRPTAPAWRPCFASPPPVIGPLPTPEAVDGQRHGRRRRADGTGRWSATPGGSHRGGRVKGARGRRWPPRSRGRQAASPATSGESYDGRPWWVSSRLAGGPPARGRRAPSWTGDSNADGHRPGECAAPRVHAPCAPWTTATPLGPPGWSAEADHDPSRARLGWVVAVGTDGWTVAGRSRRSGCRATRRVDSRTVTAASAGAGHPARVLAGSDQRLTTRACRSSTASSSAADGRRSSGAPRTDGGSPNGRKDRWSGDTCP